MNKRSAYKEEEEDGNDGNDDDIDEKEASHLAQQAFISGELTTRRYLDHIFFVDVATLLVLMQHCSSF